MNSPSSDVAEDPPIASRAAPAARRVPGMLVLVMLAVVVAGTGGWLWWQASQRNTPEARRVVCAANLHAIGQALYVYANTYAGEYAADLQTLVDVRQIIAGQLVCPLSGRAPGTSDYFYVAGIKRGDPAEWWLAWSDPEVDGGRARVLRADLKVEALGAEPFRSGLERFKLEYERARGAAPTIVTPGACRGSVGPAFGPAKPAVCTGAQT